MNIMLITNQGNTAGSTNSIFYLARGLAERDHNIYIGAREGTVLEDLSKGTKINFIPMTFNKKNPFLNAKQIKEAVEKYKIDLVNAQSSADRYSCFTAKYIYKTDFKIVHTRRQTSESSGGKLHGWFYTKFTEKIVAVSQGVKNSLIKLGIKSDHIEIIYNGTPDDKYSLIDEQLIKELKKKHNIDENSVILGSISRMKRQEQIIQAMQNFDKNIKLILVGINQDRWKKCQELIETLGLEDQVINAGVVDQKTSLNYYKIFDVNILSSVTEGLSQALLEAMYLGVPVVATNAAGNPDLIKDGENGFLFEDEDIEELTEKVKLILNDKDIKEKLIRSGKKTAKEDFSIEKVIDNYEKLFKNLLKQN